MVPTKRRKSNKPIDPGAFVGNALNILQRYVTKGSHLVVGLSGGVDSVVLLDLLVAQSRQMHYKLSAIHVNHGISANATNWSHFCCRLCYVYGIPLTVAYVKVVREAGKSLEAIAREKRYQVFSRLRTDGVDAADFLILAQHQDDQAETLLLQLFRGAGVRGLSAMPLCRNQSVKTAPQILRPLLDVSRACIESYAKQRGLQWVHDESNDSTLYHRNFLRHKVLPVLSQKYPHYAQTLQRTSQHMAEASRLLDELAESDMGHCMISGRLAIAALSELSIARAKNLLRYILWQSGIQSPSAVKLEEILRQLRTTQNDSRLHVDIGACEIRTYQGNVYIQLRREHRCNEIVFKWQGELCLELESWGGSIFFKPVRGEGLSQEKFMRSSIFIKLRQGGEYYKPDCNRPTRSLKNLLQEASMPPWERNTLPLLFCDEKLAWVPGIGIDCGFQAKPGEAGIIPEWRTGFGK